MDARDRAVTRIVEASGAYEEDDPTMLVTDMLTDLLHFSQQHGISFGRRLRMARQHYEEERDPRGEDPRVSGRGMTTRARAGKRSPS
jgi:hypothetical protein